MTTIFEDDTVNKASADFRFLGGTLRTEIFGVLDGADVSAWLKVSPKAQAAIVAKCSWRTSAQDTLTNADLGGQTNLGPGSVFFTITNAGASTNINLSANVEGRS